MASRGTMSHKSIIIAISLLVIGGLTSSFFISDVANALGELWFLSSNNVRPNVSTWGFQVPSLANCNTIDTSATGVFSCGTDSGGVSNWQFIGPNAIRPTTTVGIIVSASSTFAGDLTVNSDQYPLGASLFIDASEGRVGIGTTTMSTNLLTVGTTTHALVVDNVNQVGIGTTTPSTKLAVAGNIMGSGNIVVYGTTVTSTFSGGLSVGNNAALVVNQAASANSLYIATNGKVGIGTTGPSEKLTVFSGNMAVGGGTATTTIRYGLTGAATSTFAGDISAMGVLSVGDGSATSTLRGASAATSTINSGLTVGNNAALVVNQAASANSLYINPSGSVGIGTTAPDSPLHIIGVAQQLHLQRTVAGGSVYQTFGTTASNAYIGIESSSGGAIVSGSLGSALVLGSSSSKATQFFTGNLIRMTIDSGGNVGIGTTTPTSLLTLSSTGSLALPYGNPTVDNSGEIGINTDQASSSIRYYDGTAERVIFDVFEKSFWIASTTDDENNNSFNDATSTFSLWNPSRRATLVGLYGKTDVGTVNFACGDGTNWTETIVANSTGVEDDGSMTNSAFTQREDFQCKIGSALTVPSKITITAEFRYEAD